MAGIAVVLIAAAVLSRLWTRSLVRPINEINLENPLQNRVYDELTPMLRRMAEQNRRLETQMREINARRGELETIIGHMNEGTAHSGCASPRAFDERQRPCHPAYGPPCGW